MTEKRLSAGFDAAVNYEYQYDILWGGGNDGTG
jgi:hypothetical protein